MKLIFTALIALCTVAATFGDEGKFGAAWVEGHNYKVVDGQLIDLGPAPTPPPTLAATPSTTPTQPTIVINNNIINSAPAPVPAPTPAQQQGDSISVQPWNFIVDVWMHYSNYDSAWITHFGTRGTTVGRDQATFVWNGYVITEGYNQSGICDIILFAHVTGSDLKRGEINTILGTQIPVGYVWHGYNGNSSYATWECTVWGHDWYAMYYYNPGSLNGYAITRSCLRIGTESALASRGYFNGRVAAAAPRVAKRKSPVHHSRPAPASAAPEVSLGDL